VEMKQAYLRLPGEPKSTSVPSRITHAGQHMTGESSPTIHYINLYQFKRLGIPAAGGAGGAFKKIHMSSIENIETVMHLHWLRKEFPHMTDGERIMHTASVRYTIGTLRQMGYQPVGDFKVIGTGHRPRIGILLDETSDPAIKKEYTEILEMYGFDRNESMESNFDITFSVAPE
jgi:hypothetical protein